MRAAEFSEEVTSACRQVSLSASQQSSCQFSAFVEENHKGHRVRAMPPAHIRLFSEKNRREQAVPVNKLKADS